MTQVDEFVSVTEAKNKLLDLIRRLQRRQRIVAITRDGVPSAVLLSVAQFEGLMETIEILSDRKTLRGLKRSLAQADNLFVGPRRTVYEELRALLLARR